MVDDDNILEEIIRHFIEEHGFTKLNFLAVRVGPQSEKRLNCYKRILSEYKIPIEEERIYYGDFWKKKGEYAVEKWLSSSSSFTTGNYLCQRFYGNHCSKCIRRKRNYHSKRYGYIRL